MVFNAFRFSVLFCALFNLSLTPSDTCVATPPLTLLTARQTPDSASRVASSGPPNTAHVCQAQAVRSLIVYGDVHGIAPYHLQEAEFPSWFHLSEEEGETTDYHG